MPVRYKKEDLEIKRLKSKLAQLKSKQSEIISDVKVISNGIIRKV